MEESMSKKPKKTKPTKQSEPTVQVAKPDEKPLPAPEPIPEQPAVKPEPFDVQKEILFMKAVILDLLAEVAELVAAQRPLRRPTANGKIQIKDKQTGKIYQSKNSTYKSLLKAGELKELVDQGIFGPTPERNTFGWYALVKVLPDRFEEIKPEIKPDSE
jgi:hypothetical protein